MTYPKHPKCIKCRYLIQWDNVDKDNNKTITYECGEHKDFNLVDPYEQYCSEHWLVTERIDYADDED